MAGGSGTRMKQPLPKQFIDLSGKPVLVHTIQAFLAYDPSIAIVLVLPREHVDTWEGIHGAYLPEVPVQVAFGGPSRFQSVKAGLQYVPAGLVAIHDAVRPLISAEVIGASFESAQAHGSGVVMVPVKDSIRMQVNGSTLAQDRSRYFAVQTPQTFDVALIKRAFEQEELPTFTDDASVYEAAGGKVWPVAGDYSNLKITTPEDLIVARALLG